MRWFYRAVIATAVTAAWGYLWIPPNIGEHPLELPQIRTELAMIFVGALAIVWFADAVIASARRRPYPLRRSVVVSFITGLLCAIFALSWSLAMLSVLLAPAGIAAGLIARRKERASNEQHAGLNLIGLILNSFGLLVAGFQILIAI